MVKLIQTGSYVALTVVHSSRFASVGSPGGAPGDNSGLGHDRRDSVRHPGMFITAT